MEFKNKRASFKEEIESYGYEHFQRNGQLCIKIKQEIWERISGSSEPPRDFEIYVCKLPSDCYEHEVFPVFQKIGLIYEFRLLINFSSLSRQKCYIMYTCEPDKVKAIECFHKFCIRPKHQINVYVSTNNCRLEIKDISRDFEYRTIVKDSYDNTDRLVKIHFKVKNTGDYDIVLTYESHDAAAMARRYFVHNYKHTWVTTPAEWGEPNLKQKLETEFHYRVTFENGICLLTKLKEPPCKINLEFIKESCRKDMDGPSTNAQLGHDFPPLKLDAKHLPTTYLKPQHKMYKDKFAEDFHLSSRTAADLPGPSKPSTSFIPPANPSFLYETNQPSTSSAQSEPFPRPGNSRRPDKEETPEYKPYHQHIQNPLIGRNIKNIWETNAERNQNPFENLANLLNESLSIDFAKNSIWDTDRKF